MKRKIQFLIWGLALILSGTGLQAQTTKVLPGDPAEFIAEFHSRVTKFGNKELGEWADAFQERWIGGSITASQQERIIGQTNIMLLKNYDLNGDVVQYIKAFELVINADAFGKLNTNEFFSATDSCVLVLDRKQTGRFFRFIQTFCEGGQAFKTSNSSWTFSQPDPELKFGTFTDEELGKTVSFPYMVFSNTDLFYRNSKDSTLVRGTKGMLNLGNRMFKGDGGRIDWSKMQLDPNDVYAEVLDYNLNLNYSFVKFDTVLFHYNSLIGKPLKGKYEDINKGYGDINKANYPYFRSYDGGVVIENFIPNVRYEGGFSLRGVRKIGSAYFKWVDIPEEELKEEEASSDEEDGSNGDDMYADFDIEYETDNPFYFSEADEIEDDWEEEPGEGEEFDTESEDEAGGGDFDFDFDPDMLNKQLLLVKAQLTIFRNGEPAMNLRANEFVLDMEKLVSKRTEVALYINKEDSITHPSVSVIYEVDSSEVTLIKDVKDKFAHQAFLSPYHNYYLYFDAIRWKTTTDEIRFTAIIDKENELSAIESKDFFKKQRYSQFKGVLKFNPIGAIYRYATLHPGEEIYPNSITDEYNEPDELQKLIYAMDDLEGSGFIEYDKKTQLITPLPKLEDWAKAARGRKDYDAVQLVSQVKSGNNAVLNLNDLEFSMEGVPFFSLSDSQFVRCRPNQQHVTVLENRDLNYDGIVAAGKLDFYGRITPDTSKRQDVKGKFTFQYDNYKILCDSLDSLRFVLIRDPGMMDKFSPLQKALRKTTIEGVTGAIYINKPTNKSGLEPMPEYPVFDSYTKSYIYWAKSNVRDGVYAKDKLYFSIDPFVLDSLDDFNERALSFEGEFYSSEILPKMRQRLAVMEDQTLGMKEITPDTGYAVYGGKGRIYNEIRLDGDGLSGNGQIDFLHTTTKSDTFQLFFDSVKAVTKEFYMPGGEKDGAYFPELKATGVNYKWLTKEDKVELETMKKGDPMVMFGGEGVFEGKLIITPEGLMGDGKLTLGNVTVESDEIIFKENDFEARKGTFIVYDKNNPGKELYKATDMQVDYDVATHDAQFQTEAIGKPNSFFPEQKYASSLGKGSYSKGTNDLKLESLSAKPTDNYFYSSNKQLDSLNFLASNAYYNFDQKEIKIDGVPYIYVADAKITPDTGKVSIKPDGQMEKLRDARIEANVKTMYHDMYDADVEITSARMYMGSGKYDYPEVMEKKQFINLTDITVQGDSMTVAKGVIEEDQDFYLTDRIFFKGQTFLEANNKFMRFSGEVKIDSENEFFADQWFEFEGIVNPDSVFIPIKQEKLGNLIVGLHYIKRNRVYYSTFLQPVKNNDDIRVATAEGGLTFDRLTQEFRIGSENKLTGVEYRGTTSSLQDQDNVITTVGKLDFPFNWGKNTIDLTVAGRWRDDMSANEIEAELTAGFNLSAIPKEAFAKLADRAKMVTAANPDIDWNNTFLLQGMAELLDPNYRQEDKNMKEFLKEVANANLYTDIKVAKKLEYSFVFSSMRFKYSEDYHSLFAAGDFAIIGINGEPVNKMSTTNSKIEYCKGKYTPAGVSLPDTLRMLVEFDDLNWVYFEYYDEVLNTASSDLDGYNAVLAAELEKRKKSEGYRFELVSEADKDAFTSRFANRYIWKQ